MPLVYLPPPRHILIYFTCVLEREAVAKFDGKPDLILKAGQPLRFGPGVVLTSAIPVAGCLRLSPTPSSKRQALVVTGSMTCTKSQQCSARGLSRRFRGCWFLRGITRSAAKCVSLPEEELLRRGIRRRGESPERAIGHFIRYADSSHLDAGVSWARRNVGGVWRNRSLAQLIVLASCLTLSTLAPTAPGFLGSLQLLTGILMESFGAGRALGIAVVTGMHVFCYLPIALIGVGVGAVRWQRLLACRSLREASVPEQSLEQGIGAS